MTLGRETCRDQGGDRGRYGCRAMHDGRREGEEGNLHVSG